MSQSVLGTRTGLTGRARIGVRRAASGVTTARPRAGIRVVDARRTRVSGPGFALLMVLMLVGGLLASLTLNTLRGEGSFELADLQREQILLAETQTGLRADVAEARSADRLTASARGLGMVPSPSTAFIRLSDGAVLGVATPGEKVADDTVAVVTRSVLDATGSTGD